MAVYALGLLRFERLQRLRGERRRRRLVPAELPCVLTETCLADELAKRRLVPESVEVGVLSRKVTETRPSLEGDPKVTDRVLFAAGPSGISH